MIRPRGEDNKKPANSNAAQSADNMKSMCLSFEPNMTRRYCDHKCSSDEVVSLHNSDLSTLRYNPRKHLSAPEWLDESIIQMYEFESYLLLFLDELESFSYLESIYCSFFNC